MSRRACEDWLNAYMDYTESTEPPRMYRLWTGISCIAAALQRKCMVNMGHQIYYPNMYVVLVGPAGVRKGTAMAPGYRLLSDLGIKMAAQSTTREALIKRLGEANFRSEDPVTGKIRFHSSMTVFSDEFTVFIGYQQRDLMAALTDWFDCKDRWTYDTKNMGTDEILGVWVNILGATTPALLQATLTGEAFGGGLTSRIVFVFEEKKGKTNPLPIITEAEMNLYDDLRNDLEKIHLLSGQFKVTQGFLDKWTDWYIAQDASPPRGLHDERFGGYLNRRPTHLMKLSMILCASAGDDMEIDECHLNSAIRILEATERKMPRTFSGVGRSDISDLVTRICGYVAQIGEAPQTEIMRRFYYDADDQTMDRVIRTLEQMGYVQKRISDAGAIIRFTGPESFRQYGVI